MRDRTAQKPAAAVEDVDQTAKEETPKKKSTAKSQPKAKKKTSRK
jgi:hypothetical protein